MNFKCPNCGYIMERREYGKTLVCEKCGALIELGVITKNDGESANIQAMCENGRSIIENKPEVKISLGDISLDTNDIGKAIAKQLNRNICNGYR